MKNIFQQTLAVIISGVFSRSLVALMNFAILIISSRYLGAASRGEISLYLLNIALVQLVNEVYTGYGLIRFIPKYNFRSVLLKGLLFTIVVSPVVYALVAGFGTQVDGYIKTGYATALLVILHTFNCILLLGRERVKLYYFLCMLQPAVLLSGMCIAIFVFQIYTFEAFAWSLLFSFAVGFLVSGTLVLALPAAFNKTFRLAPVVSNGLLYQGALIMFVLVNRFSYYLLPGKQFIGVYSAASSVMEATLVLSASLAPMLISRVANRGDNQGSVRLTVSIARLSLLVAIAGIAFLVVLPQTFFTAILGEGFVQLKSVMLCYTPAALFLSMFLPVSAYLTATGRQKLVLFGYGCGFLTALLIAPALVSHFNMYGAAVTADLAYLVMGAVLIYFFVRLNKSQPAEAGNMKQDILNLKNAFRLRRF